MKTRYSLVFWSVLLVQQCFAVEQAPVNDKSICVSIVHNDPDTWQKISIDDEKQLLTKLETALLDIGFDKPKAMLMGETLDTDENCADEAALNLNIAVASIRTGKPKKGLSFTIEISDPRAPIIGKVDVMPVRCRLTAGSTQHLLDVVSSDEPVNRKYLFGNDTAGNYIADKLVDACSPLLFKQKIVKLEGTPESSERISTEYADVYIEKITPGNKPLSPEVSTNTAALAVEEADKEIKTPAEEAAEADQTQYVIHNRGDKLTITFGHTRE